ncbi:hypothetical protein [Actinobacillus porcinus]|uniref:hypothetical protein n=1 Tax=Actinobacillus porcinus TaxID=51048 RepID=UPI002355FBC2|nr:hypothetical protein [Actinobacillus porcinus]
MNINDIEHDMYRQIKKHNRRVNTEGYNNDFFTIQEDYYYIYNQYLQDLLINLIRYENAPKTLDQRFLEWQLRNFGVAAVAADDKDHIALLNGDKSETNSGNYWGQVIKLGMFGYLTAPAKQTNPFNPKDEKDKLEFITQLNYQDLTKGYVVIPNKFNFYFNYGFNGVITDFQQVARISKTLALIKALELANTDQMRQQYVFFVKNGNLTGKQIIEQIQQGVKAIGVDSDVTDISSLVQFNSFDIQNYLPALKEQWNNELNEFLTMLGINTVGVDKKERLVATEAAANAQLTEASANIYLEARQEQMDLINEMLGTEIKVSFNQDSYKKLVELQEDTSTGEVKHEQEEETEDIN